MTPALSTAVDALDVLVVEDNPSDVRLIQELLKEGSTRHVATRVAGRMRDAIEILRDRTFSAVLLDLGLPDSEGLSTLTQVAAQAARTPVVVLTGLDDERVAALAVQGGAQDYLVKGHFDGHHLYQAVRHAIDRQAAADALRDSELRYRRLIEESPQGIVIHAHGTVVMANRSLAEMFGTGDPHAFIGQPVETFAPQPLTNEDAALSTAPAGVESSRSVRYRATRLDGTPCVIEVHSRQVDWNGEPATFSSIVDITEQYEATENLRESEARFRQLVDNVKEAFLLLEQPGHRPLYVSRVWEDIFGRSIDSYRANPGLLQETVYEDDRPIAAEIDDLIARGEPAAGVYRVVRPDQTERWVRSRAFPVHTPDGRLHRTVNLLEDITEVRRTEEQLQQSQKMEAVGQLAGGIAHDFNNLLTGIMAYSEMLIEDLGPVHASTPSVEWILAAAESAGRLTGQLLAFSRRQVVQFQSIDLNEVILRLEPLLRRTIGEHITIDLALDAPLAAIRSDPGQLEQVLMNLAVNARDAMPAGGSLTITTANIPGRRNAVIRSDLRGVQGPRVMLSVTDTGKGMDHATQQRVFEPFFTTKPLGRGTGLGLATVYGIVTQSGGTIEVRSTPGRGSVFTVMFPADARPPELVAEDAETPEALHGTETILVVEDEAATRAAICGMVARRGYYVIAASGGEDALRKSQAHDGPIDLLLTDIVMPGLNGRHVAELLRRERPDMHVLFMSGYTDGVLVEDFVLNDDIAFIQKPFSSDGIARKLRAVFDKS